MKKLLAKLQLLLPTHLITSFVGRFANCECPRFTPWFIKWYIKHYQVDMLEAKIQDIKQYKTFNDFFTRELLEDARPISADPSEVISPVDGAVYHLGQLSKDEKIIAKQHHFSLHELLANDNNLIQQFKAASFATIYLSPKDYHRIHMPITGRLLKMTYVPGRLFSVNPTSISAIDNIFSRNERVICHFETERGAMLIILVGALIVGSMQTVWHGMVRPKKRNKVSTWEYQMRDEPIELKQGEEMGRFLLGSTVILMFPEGKIDWADYRVDEKINLNQLLENISKL